jgi:hypothetical protein
MKRKAEGASENQKMLHEEKEKITCTKKTKVKYKN